MRTKDMTKGSPSRLILGFAVPIMLGNICQQLYTIVDAAFVGRFAGLDALAAVGTADWFGWLVMGIIWGYTQGFSILISQYFGADEKGHLRRAVGTSVTLTALIAMLTLLISQLLVLPVLHLLDVPGDIRPQASVYLRILFAGLPILGAYHIQAAILRAVGDAKTPLRAMLLASAANIALDALFVIFFHWGVAGAAAATVIAQGASAVYCFFVIRRVPVIRFEKRDLRPDREMVRRLIRLGTPTAAQNTIIALGGMALQRVINGFGSIFIAGYTATNKMYGLMEMAATSYGAAIAAYTGQNAGAGRIDRIQKGTRTGAWLSVTTALAISAVLFIAGRGVLSLFVNPAEALREQALDVAQQYLFVMLYALPVLYLLYVYRSALQGMGDTVTPMVSGVAELIMRVGSALLLPRFWGQDGIYWAEPAAWAGGTILLMVSYYRQMRKQLRKEEI